MIAVTIMPVFIASWYPDSSWVWGIAPVAPGPDVPVSIPAVVPAQPHIAWSWGWPIVLDDGRRWSDANDNLRLRG